MITTPSGKMHRSITRAVAQPSQISRLSPYRRLATSKGTTPSPHEQPSKDDKSLEENAKEAQANKKTTRTIAEADADMMRKMAGITGEGGEAGVEYEDGKPVAMKRSVKNNMFRYI